jgi:hypothetical protein
MIVTIVSWTQQSATYDQQYRAHVFISLLTLSRQQTVHLNDVVYGEASKD